VSNAKDSSKVIGRRLRRYLGGLLAIGFGMSWWSFATPAKELAPMLAALDEPDPVAHVAARRSPVRQRAAAPIETSRAIVAMLEPADHRVAVVPVVAPERVARPFAPRVEPPPQHDTAARPRFARPPVIAKPPVVVPPVATRVTAVPSIATVVPPLPPERPTVTPKPMPRVIVVPPKPPVTKPPVARPKPPVVVPHVTPQLKPPVVVVPPRIPPVEPPTEPVVRPPDIKDLPVIDDPIDDDPPRPPPHVRPPRIRTRSS
jgi:hypothetical protein